MREEQPLKDLLYVNCLTRLIHSTPTCQPFLSRRALSRGPVRVEGSRMRNTIFGCPPLLEYCFSTPIMVRECPSCCRYSGALSGQQHGAQQA